MFKITSYNNNPYFGMKNNSKAAKEVLKNVDEATKDTIIKGVDSFCNDTQKQGIKGKVTLVKVYKDEKLGENMLKYLLTPTKTGKTTVHEVPVYEFKKAKNQREHNVDPVKTLRTFMLRTVRHIFDN